MTESDRAAKEAEELLPCCDVIDRQDCLPDETPCPTCEHRPAVAAKLREAYAQIELLQKQIELMMGMPAYQTQAEIASLRKSLDRLNDDCLRAEQERDKLRAELAGLEKFAESWPCHCAESYPGAVLYHGHDCQTAIAQEFVAQWRAAKEKA